MRRAHAGQFHVHEDGDNGRISPLRKHDAAHRHGGRAGEKAVEIIRENCAQRMEKVPSVISSAGPYAVFNYTTAELPVGGATVFVTDVEYYEKM